MSLNQILEEINRGYKFTSAAFVLSAMVLIKINEEEIDEKKISSSELKPVYKTMYEIKRFYEMEGFSEAGKYFSIGILTYLVTHPLKTFRTYKKIRESDDDEMKDWFYHK